eukprot:TRINITY_DN7844_c0_g1_i2.p1 TRINITY_DN7844_c0_g1~~TRINITY_DN7844_c0_g1_i2.p1  ORF type:complete len:567 (-),score=113.74 TRINITY_DN7844_c0_g1_i2:53-1693(-)
MDSEVKVDGVKDPFYFRSIFPDVFKIQAKESRAEPMSIANHISKQRLDPKMIEEKLNEIESLINRTNSHDSIHTVKSSHRSHTEFPLNPFEDANEVKDDQKDELQKKIYRNFYNLLLEYKVSLLQDIKDEMSAKTFQEKPQTKKESDNVKEIQDRQKEIFIHMEDDLNRKLTIGNWTGKYIPQEKHLLKKMFKSHRDAKIKKIAMTDCRVRSKTGTARRPLVQPIRPNIIDASNKQKHMEEIVMLQKMKKMLKQNALLDLDSNTTCYTANPDRFAQKRFRINPRFTWLCKAEEDGRDWISNINVNIGRLGDIAETRGKVARSNCGKRQLQQCKKLDSSFTQLKCAEQRKETDKSRLSSLNLSEMPTNLYLSFYETFKSLAKKAASPKEDEKSFSKHKGRLVSKKKRESPLNKQPGGSEQTFLLDKIATIPQRDYWKLEHRKKRSTSTNRTNKKASSPDPEMALKKQNKSSKKEMAIGEHDLTKYVEMKKSSRSRIESGERKLVSRQRLHRKHRIIVKNNPIFDLSIVRPTRIANICLLYTSPSPRD